MVNVDKDGDKIFNKYYCQKKNKTPTYFVSFFLKSVLLIIFYCTDAKLKLPACIYCASACFYMTAFLQT